MPNVTFSKKDFTSALTQLQTVIPNRPSLPILSGVLFQLSPTTLTMAATDLYMGISISIPAQSDIIHSFVVSAKPLLDLCKTLHSTEIELHLDQSELHFTAGTVQTVMQTQDSAEFPVFPEVQGKAIALSTKVLSEITKKVIISTSPDAARPILTGVYFKAGAQPKIVATDGFRLSILEVSKQDQLWDESIVIPAKFFAELSKNTASLTEKLSLVYSSDQKQVMAKWGGTIIYSRTLEGEYPPFEKIIPSGSETTVTVVASDLLEQVKRAVIFSRDSMNAIQLDLSAEKVVVKAQSPTAGQFTGEISNARVEGKNILLAFNSKYLIDYLLAAEDLEIQMAITDSLKPVLITSAQIANWQYVVMPFKLNG